MVGYEGEWISIAGAITEAEAILANPSADRKEAAFYKDLFDGLNNNTQKVISYEPCETPWATE